MTFDDLRRVLDEQAAFLGEASNGLLTGSVIEDVRVDPFGVRRLDLCARSTRTLGWNSTTRLLLIGVWPVLDDCIAAVPTERDAYVPFRLGTLDSHTDVSVFEHDVLGPLLRSEPVRSRVVNLLAVARCDRHAKAV